MRMLCVLTAVVILAPSAMARVWASVYRCDEATPLAPVDANYPTAYRDIMVGTHLVIVISSDSNEPWSGSLRLSWDDANEATLSGRGFDYEGSCLEAAGARAKAWDFFGPEGIGLEYQTDLLNAVPGAWFAFDYRAEQVGLVDLEMDRFALEQYIPVETLSFTQVASRDFTSDGIVNFEDFARLAAAWRSAVASDANSAEMPFDLNADDRIDTGDLARFAEYWLERTDCGASAGDPNGAPVMP
jgi:hypothetical protein